MKEVKNIVIKSFLKLRVIVCYLGEKNQLNWWDTNLLNPTGEQFMTLTFPRSTFLSSVITVTEAAKNLHDAKVGKGKIYHLFRLPYFFEEKLFYIIKSSDNNGLKEIIMDKKAALNSLEKIANNKIPTKRKNIEATFALFTKKFPLSSPFGASFRCLWM